MIYYINNYYKLDYVQTIDNCSKLAVLLLAAKHDIAEAFCRVKLLHQSLKSKHRMDSNKF